MAVHASGNLDILVQDLINGGYRVRAVEKVHDLRGRSADVFLNNGVVVKWDEFSRVIWAEGACEQREKVESYFANLYERRWIPRGMTVMVSRFITSRQRWGSALLIWLLRQHTTAAHVVGRWWQTTTTRIAASDFAGKIRNSQAWKNLQRIMALSSDDPTAPKGRTFSQATNIIHRFLGGPQEIDPVMTAFAFQEDDGILQGPMVKKLLHTRMRVNDLEKTVRFYEDALGLKVVRRHTSPRGAQLAFLATPNSDEEIEICQLPGAPVVQVQSDLMHLAFEVDDLTGFASALEKKGYKLSDGPTQTGSGSTIAFIDAPEGYEVELIQKGK